MVRLDKIRRLKENLAVKRFFITLILTISISLFYFNLYKFLETPKLTLIRKFEISNAFVWIRKDIDSGFFAIERTYEYKINYPYLIKRSFYCYDLPKNAIFYLKTGEMIEVDYIEDKVCISSEIREFVIKEVEKRDIRNFVRLIVLENSYKVLIKNPFDFPLNLDIRIDVESLINKQGNIYRDGILILSNASYFFDSKVISPYGNLEYEIRRD
ncbi:MAG: hypothetical protein QW367_02065 [Candidatus Aenigmatarchaeota archaeon]